MMDFCDKGFDVIYILGPTFAPDNKGIIHLFCTALPKDLYELLRGAPSGVFLPGA